MCGIVGIINKKSVLKNTNALVKMTNSIINRGPDDVGYITFNDNVNAYFGDDSIEKSTAHITTTFDKKIQLGFGFRQLKIIDLSTQSHQPMCDESQKFWIVFNGEIYNYKEIKSELQALGHHFKSNSDTEVLLIGYKQWQEKILDKLNGMFAFAIFDIAKNEVFFARDRIGIKPFYFYNDENYFLFGSTIKSIIDSKLYKPKVDWNGLWQNFRFLIAQRPYTCFDGIHALEAGHYLKYNLNNNKILKKQYWQIPVNTQDLSMTEKQATNLIEESLYNAVNYRLISDVEVGTFMSGGIDSTLISVLASKQKSNIKAMTLGFKDYKDYNEVTQASDTAKIHNINHHVYQANSKDIIDNIDAIITAFEEPYFHLSANYILAKMAKQNNLKVVLNGLGGDELFGGYDEYQKLFLWYKLRKNKRLVSLLPKVHQKIKKGKQLATYNSIDEIYSHYYTNYNDSQLGELFNRDYSTQKVIKDLYNQENITFHNDFEALSYYNLKSYIGNQQMRTVDQLTMHFSIEGRFPMLDHNFIETAFKVPTKFKYKNRIQKYALKQVAKKHIAPSCLQMSKKGLGLPLEYWIKNDLKELVSDSISKLKKRGAFNPKYIDKLIKGKNEKIIWQLTTTELWFQKFIDE